MDNRNRTLRELQADIEGARQRAERHYRRGMLALCIALGCQIVLALILVLKLAMRGI